MGQIRLTSRVGSDGVLSIQVPMGMPLADQEVNVVINPKQVDMSHDEYRAWVQSMAGSWQGDFERPEQGVLEEREPL